MEEVVVEMDVEMYVKKEEDHDYQNYDDSLYGAKHNDEQEPAEDTATEPQQVSVRRSLGQSIDQDRADNDPLARLNFFQKFLFFMKMLTPIPDFVQNCLPEVLNQVDEEATPAKVGFFQPPSLKGYMTEYGSIMYASYVEILTMYVATLSIMEASDAAGDGAISDLPIMLSIMSIPLFTAILLNCIFAEMTARRFMFYRCLECMTIMDINNEGMLHSLLMYYLVVTTGYMFYVSVAFNAAGIGAVLLFRGVAMVTILGRFFNMEQSSISLIKFIEDDSAGIPKKNGEPERKVTPHAKWTTEASKLLGKMRCVEERKINEEFMALKTALVWALRDIIADLYEAHEPSQEMIDELASKYIQLRRDLVVDFADIGSDDRRVYISMKVKTFLGASRLEGHPMHQLWERVQATSTYWDPHGNLEGFMPIFMRHVWCFLRNPFYWMWAHNFLSPPFLSKGASTLEDISKPGDFIPGTLQIVEALKETIFTRSETSEDNKKAAFLKKFMSEKKMNRKLWDKINVDPEFPLKRDSLMRKLMTAGFIFFLFSVFLIEIYGIYLLISGGSSSCTCNHRSLTKLDDNTERQFNNGCGSCDDVGDSDHAYRKSRSCMVYFGY
mmetsp:Transcript_6971/g.12048  ORF Transcript_6971/g.12048 Transcript_6971/m.12048 type:complete len:610 (+) Transcript_6971:135-1964(+)|eukprot:CAMPEP_0198206218 /NCGR_PEP_ID=MMETSP1445-20131203/9756_1 /TAXON_ID=36898 /ORGANISM="Pyramimonas sp., Strain CCMP2087" /LENGTH=609 /DNA_ID=CAMNT_0043878829 /DNA_START=149 /DNA_END=1978 /DNA_ORIENTATION=+